MKRLSRRALLRGAVGGVAIALPWLEAMSRPAAAAGAPKRAVFMFSPNGVSLDRWFPTGGPSDFTLSAAHQPLAPHKDDLILLRGVDNEISYHSPAGGHLGGMGCLLTGVPLSEGSLFVGGAGKPSGWASGISVDQLIAREIGKKATTKLGSLELAVQPYEPHVFSRLCYLGPDQPIAPRHDPWKVFDDLFGDLEADPTGLEQLRQQRHSVLDAVLEEYHQLRGRVGQRDRVKLEQHLDAIREVEKRLDITSTAGGNCQQPEVGSPLNPLKSANFPIVGKAMMDLMVMALACDMTRVASLQWSRAVGQTVHTWLGHTRTHHDLSHDAKLGEPYVTQLEEIDRWYSEQLAYLIASMKNIQEGSGTMFDNTTILWVNELGYGWTHQRRSVPFVIAGSCGGYFKTGRYLKYPGVPHNNLLLSMCHAMDVPVSSFGTAHYCTGPLPGLT